MSVNKPPSRDVSREFEKWQHTYRNWPQFEGLTSKNMLDAFQGGYEAAKGGEEKHAWFRFLKARTACVHEFTRNGDSDEKITRSLSFADVDHMNAVRNATTVAPEQL